LKKLAASLAPSGLIEMALLAVDEARARILFGVKPLAADSVKLAQACGRVLARDVKAKRDQPPFAASAMDGYAVRHADLGELPAPLKLIGVSAAGHGFKGTVTHGTAVRILTGAPLPKGADTIVIQENTDAAGKRIAIHGETPRGKNIRPAGLDFARGDLLVARGTCLTPRDIGLLAAGNSAAVPVYRKPRVVLFTTGDELVLPGKRPRADQIVSSNSHALSAMVESFGADVVNLGIVRDDLKATMVAVRKGLGADVLLTTGGASVGDHDYVQAAFKACGVNISFWKIALRPGKPFMYGRKGRTHVMGLPGNPVSALVTARIFLKPLLRCMLGLSASEAEATAVLDGTLPANDQRQDYVRASLETHADGRRVVKPFDAQDSSMQRVMQQSQAFIIRAPGAAAVTDGNIVPVMLIDF
jgi:molybdopterin molybdotransferase